MDSCDTSRLVSHLHIDRQFRGYDRVEFLIHQNVYHCFRRLFAHGLSVSDFFEDKHQVVRCHGIIQSLGKRFIILYTPHHLDILCAQITHWLCNLFGIHQLYDNIGREIAAYDDHVVNQCIQGPLFRCQRIQLLFAIFCWIERERAAIYNAFEIVLDKDRVGEGKLSFCCLLEHLDHHRCLHGTGGVETFSFVNKQCFTRGKIFKGDCVSSRLFCQLLFYLFFNFIVFLIARK